MNFTVMKNFYKNSNNNDGKEKGEVNSDRMTIKSSILNDRQKNNIIIDEHIKLEDRKKIMFRNIACLYIKNNYNGNSEIRK